MTIRSARLARYGLLIVSAASYLASWSDLDDPSDARDLTPARVAEAAAPRPDTPNVIAHLIARDPFAGEPTSATSTDLHAPFDAPVAPAPPVTETLADARAVVPNIDPGAVAMFDPPTAAPPAIAVRATIVGRHPVASITYDGDTRIVQVGDEIGPVRVTSIDLTGIIVSGGMRFDLPVSYAATPAPAGTPFARTDDDVLLREIRRFRALVSAQAADDGRHGSPTTRSTTVPEEPTAAPLPTVNARGLAPGVNPTPDLADPTARPYPFPYPPAPHRRA